MAISLVFTVCLELCRGHEGDPPAPKSVFTELSVQHEETARNLPEESWAQSLREAEGVVGLWRPGEDPAPGWSGSSLVLAAGHLPGSVVRGPGGLTVVPWVGPAARGGPGPREVCTLNPPTPTALHDLVPSPEDIAGGEYSRLSSLPHQSWDWPPAYKQTT